MKTGKHVKISICSEQKTDATFLEKNVFALSNLHDFHICANSNVVRLRWLGEVIILVNNSIHKTANMLLANVLLTHKGTFLRLQDIGVTSGPQAIYYICHCGPNLVRQFKMCNMKLFLV